MRDAHDRKTRQHKANMMRLPDNDIKSTRKNVFYAGI